MTWHKHLEIWAKQLLALFSAALLWRPGRRLEAFNKLPPPHRVLIVRIDDRVGEALLTTPLFGALKKLSPPPRVHVLVHRKVARVLAGHPQVDEVLAFDRRCLWLGMFAPGIRALRQRGYEVVVDCANWSAPSVTSALVSRLVGPRAVVIGPKVWPVEWLQSLSVPARQDTRSEVLQRMHLLSPLGTGGEKAALSFRAPALTPGFQSYLEGLAGSALAVLNPGGRLGWRRISPEAFVAAGKALVETGHRPVVTWGPGEEALASQVAQGVPGAVLAPATNLDELAALMNRARLTVCNNTGPMHLSVALGTPTLGLFLRMEMDRWGHPGEPHRMVDLTPLAASAKTLEQGVFEAVRSFAQRALSAQSLSGRV